MTGSLTDTYAAALQHGIANLPRDVIRLGVVRKPPPWFYATIDENRRALGPPADLLQAVKDRHEELIDEGVSDAEAQNRAMDERNYDDRYRHYLERSADARAAIEEIRRMLIDGRNVALVCFENTDEKRCHRTVLVDWIQSGPG